MTLMDAIYHYAVAPNERTLLALDKMRDVYGVRRVELREGEKAVCVEYDASRLTGTVIHQLLLRAGIDIVEGLSAIAPPQEAVSLA